MVHREPQNTGCTAIRPTLNSAPTLVLEDIFKSTVTLDPIQFFWWNKPPTLADLNAEGLNAQTVNDLLTMYVGATSQQVLRMGFVSEREAQNFDTQVTVFWSHLIGLKGMALNLVTDNMGVVVFRDVRAIIGVDNMKCTGAIADVHRLCSYSRAQGVKTSELVEFSSSLKGMRVLFLASIAKKEPEKRAQVSGPEKW